MPRSLLGCRGWVRPTARAMRLGMVATGAFVAALVLVAADAADGPPGRWLDALTSTAVLAGALLTLDDPAHDLLVAVPVGRPRRLLHRLLLLSPFVVVTLTLLDLCSAALDVGFSTSAASVVALAAVGLAAYGIAMRLNPGRSAVAGAGIIVGWTAWAAVTPEGEALASLAHATATDPWAVTATAVAVATIAHLPRRAAWAHA